MFVVCDHEQRARPLRPVAQGVVDVVDELFAKRDVVIGVLAVAGRFPAGFEETERQRACPCAAAAWKSVKRPKCVSSASVMSVKSWRVSGGLFVAVDRPAGRVVGEQRRKWSVKVKVLVLSSIWPWLVAATAKALLGKVSVGTEENHWSQTANPSPGPKRTGSVSGVEHHHDVVGHRARQDRPARVPRLPCEGGGIVRDEAGAARLSRSIDVAEQLGIGGGIALPRIGAGEEVQVRRRGGGSAHDHRGPVLVAVAFFSR